MRENPNFEDVQRGVSDELWENDGRPSKDMGEYLSGQSHGLFIGRSTVIRRLLWSFRGVVTRKNTRRFKKS